MIKLDELKQMAESIINDSSKHIKELEEEIEHSTNIIRCKNSNSSEKIAAESDLEISKQIRMKQRGKLEIAKDFITYINTYLENERLKLEADADEIPFEIPIDVQI